MPNWAAGHLRVRGTKDALKAFFEQELETIAIRAGAPYLAVTAKVDVQIGDDELFVPLNLDNFPKGTVNPGSGCDFYIKGTHRNFVQSEICGDVGNEVNVIVCDFRAAWDVDADPYVEKSAKHHVDIKINAWERGMEFSRTIEIVDGKLVRDDTTNYENWMWDSVNPQMGG